MPDARPLTSATGGGKTRVTGAPSWALAESAKSESLCRFSDTVWFVEGEPIPDEKRMRLRYSGTCRVCSVELPAKAEAIYERSSKTVRCITHDTASDASPGVSKAVDAGSPGASARREFERRKAKREERTRTKHPKLGGLILALSDDPQSTRAWDTGALGEERLGNRLNELASDSLRVLHDRRIPGSRANIDHIAVASTGVYVIDAKKYKGRPQLKIEGGFLRPRVEKLLVGTGTAPSSSTACSNKSTSCAALSVTIYPSTACSVSWRSTGR